ncbi:MAG: RHS repeat-associated core domain-containing protein, partial [Nostoc sp.]
VSQVLLEYDANSQITTEYTYGLGLIKSDRSGNENYYHTDGLGSTRVLTNATGQVVDNYTYDAYGRLLSSTGTSSNSYQFAGEQRDSQTGLDYLRARYYDADLGRFISKDSFAGFMDDPMSQHNYLYANANPVNFIDPTGHETMGDLSAVFSIIGTLAASTGVGAGAGYLTGAALNGASGEDLLNLTDQWVAGFANTVSFGASTKVRSWLYGEVAEQNHSGFMWNMGQVAGTGVAMILGAATPENLTFSMGRDEWLATTYDAIGTGVSAWQTGTHFREGQLEWSDAFNLAPFAPFAFKGTKQFFAAAIDINGTLRSWGRMGVSAEVDLESSKDLFKVLSDEEAAKIVGGGRRDFYMGPNPNKDSSVGQQVIERMRTEGKIRNNGEHIEVLGDNGSWYHINDTDMSHIKSAVEWWNEVGYKYGKKSPEVRDFMNDPNNYILEPIGPNRSRGGKAKERYRRPEI